MEKNLLVRANCSSAEDLFKCSEASRKVLESYKETRPEWKYDIDVDYDNNQYSIYFWK